MKFKIRVLNNNHIGGFGEKSYILDAPADLTYSLQEGTYYGIIQKEKSQFHVLFYFGSVPTIGVGIKQLEMLVMDLGIEYIANNDILECEIKNYLHEIRVYERIEYLQRDTEQDKQTVVEKYLYK